jgi:hypothetical protein
MNTRFGLVAVGEEARAHAGAARRTKTKSANKKFLIKRKDL